MILHELLGNTSRLSCVKALEDLEIKIGKKAMDQPNTAIKHMKNITKEFLKDDLKILLASDIQAVLTYSAIQDFPVKKSIDNVLKDWNFDEIGFTREGLETKVPFQRWSKKNKDTLELLYTAYQPTNKELFHELIEEVIKEIV